MPLSIDPVRLLISRRHALALLLLGVTAACGSADDASQAPPTQGASQAAIGQCTRNEPLLRSPDPGVCVVDTDCPCGSFCDGVSHLCRFECMVPPAGPQEACASGTQCDDTGRCVGASTQPPALAPVLTAIPATLPVVPAAGAPAQLTVRLSMYVASSPLSNPALVAAQTTEVRVVASDGLEVSCDAASYAPACVLSSWTFAWDGVRHNASRSAWVRTLAGNPDASGQVVLSIDDLERQTAVPTVSAAAATVDGLYAGLATSSSVATGVPVTVQAQGPYLLVRDASRTIAPEGAIVLDRLGAPGDVAVPRRVAWLRPVGAAPGTPGVVGEVQATGLSVFTPGTGSLSAGFSLTLPGGAPEPWALQLQRSGGHAPECNVNADCAAGTECVPALAACVPLGVWAPTTEPVANRFDDARSLAWWTAVSPLLGTGDAPATGGASGAFATTGADLVESLLCSTQEGDAAAGRLGAMELGQTQTGTSRSGELVCISGPDPGTAMLSPGAVGLGTYRDRQGDVAISAALLDLCQQDLARSPSGSWSANYSQAVGQCANLARFVPALRLLAGSELDKRTTLTGARTRGLLVRLVQQWAQLHGFLAATGLSQRDYDDAVAATPDEPRQALLSLLDVLDAGWAALLDQRIAPTIGAAATWGPTDTSAVGDYREAKKPVVYWTFNRTPAPARDLIRGVDLVPNAASSKAGCQIRTDRDAISGDWDCPGFTATLPASAPSIAGNTDLSVTLFTGVPTAEFPPYFGGTLFVTETLAAVASPLESEGSPTLSLAHPTADGGTEWVTFSWSYALSSEFITIVRDTARQTYTLYVYKPGSAPPTQQVMTQRYYGQVGGRLAVAPRTIRLGGGQWPHARAYPGLIDDFAVFDSALSKREVFRIAAGRGSNQARRAVWPTDMTLPTSPTQDLKLSVGAAVLEGQVSELAVVARLAQVLSNDAVAACTGGDAVARANLDAGVARAARALRQSMALETLVRADGSARAGKARQELRAKRSGIVRALGALYACADPFGLADHEVPLYFGDQSGEVSAFFAASDHLLTLAEPRASTALAALDTVRARWDAARQSQLQEQLTDTARGIRVTELQTRFGEQLKRLCGMVDRTDEAITTEVEAGTFSVDSCFVVPTSACQSASTSIMDADPACYRGVIGAQLMDIRASYHAQQAAYQQWQAAVGNAEGAERLCVLKEMDLYGCSALDRHQLTGVSCPANHQGTIELVEEFNRYLLDRESEQSWLGAVVNTFTTVATVAATVASTGTGAGMLVAAAGALGILQPELSHSIEARKRQHEAVLAKRAAQDDIRSCWAAADQFHRAIGAAEEASAEATARMQTATILYQNALAEARQVVMEAPVALERERTRPAVPIAFHYWLPSAMATYREQLERARRYTYMAMRATEYDMQQVYSAPPPPPGTATPWPSRSAVVGAWRPETLVSQLAVLRSVTDARRSGNGRPSSDHLVINVARDLLGLGSEVFDVGPYLAAHARPVYSTRGEYLGEGLRFSFIPAAGDVITPVYRCAERLARTNVARAGLVTSALAVKLLKRTVFGGRDCSTGEMRLAQLRPEHNLLIGTGEPGQPGDSLSYLDQPNHTVASIETVDLNIAGNVDGFLNLDSFTNGSSAELAGQGLYGDYVLLFTAPSLAAGLALTNLQELYVRFDYLSVDDTPATPAALAGKVQVEQSTAPIVVE